MSSLRGTSWNYRSFFHWLSPCWFLQPDIMGTYLPSTGTLGLGAWCGAGAPCTWDIPSKFLSTTYGCGTRPFHISTSPTSPDGCGFFNPLVVGLPLTSISDGSEWWVFFISVAISMWLCEEVSHVCLCYHLERKSGGFFLNIYV